MKFSADYLQVPRIAKVLQTSYLEKPHVQHMLHQQILSTMMNKNTGGRMVTVLVRTIEALSGASGLAPLISSALNLWKTPIIIECNSSIEAHRSFNYTLMLALHVLVGMDGGFDMVADQVRDALTKAVPFYLDSSRKSIAELGLFVAEEMSRLLAQCQGTNSVLQFGMEYQSDEPALLRAFLAAALDQTMASSSAAEAASNCRDNVTAAETGHTELNEEESDTDSIQPFETNIVEEEIVELSNGKLIRPPRFLRDCIECLNDRSQESGRDKVEVALKHVESIILRESSGTLLGRNEMKELGAELARSLLYLKDSYDESLSAYRRRALTTLAVVSENEVPCYLVHEFWHGNSLSLMERLELLTILGDAAQQLSQSVTSKPESTELAVVATSSETEATKKLASQTRYFHPHSRLMKPQKSQQNALQRSLQHWFIPFVNGFWTTELGWLRSQIGHPPRNHNLTPSLLLSSLSLYDHMESSPKQKLEPLTFLILTKWIATLALLINSVGPFDPNLRSYGKLLKEIVEWYCRFASERDVAADEMYAETRILEHPQFRNVVLLVLWTCMRLSDANPALLAEDEIVPFELVSAINGSLVMGGLDGLMEWLMVDVLRHDSLEWNRHMASSILGLVKKRLDTVVGLPAELEH